MDEAGFELSEIQWQGPPPQSDWSFHVKYSPAGDRTPQTQLLIALLGHEKKGQLDFVLDLRIPKNLRFQTPTPKEAKPEPWTSIWRIALSHDLGMMTRALPTGGAQLLRFDDTVWFDAPLTRHLVFTHLRRLYRAWVESSAVFLDYFGSSVH